jgi:hypothetical protein
VSSRLVAVEEEGAEVVEESQDIMVEAGAYQE